MTVRVEKPSVNLREKLAELDKPTGIAGEAMLRAETPQEQFQLIGAGRRNLIINGGMQVAQRGTSLTLQNSDAFGVDRMPAVVYNTGFTAPTAGTVSQTTIYGTTLDGVTFKNALRITGNSTFKLAYLQQRVEDVTAVSDTTVTVSYYVRADVSSTISMQDRVNQYFGSGGSSSVSTYNTSIDRHITTEWTRVVYQIHVPSIVGKTVGSGSHLDFYVFQSQDLSAFGWIEVTGFQVELGKVATPFEHRSYGEELALCQRYYQKTYNIGSNPGTATYVGAEYGAGAGGGTTTGYVFSKIKFRGGRMRANPTVTTYDTSGNLNKVTRDNFGVASQTNVSRTVSDISDETALIYSTSGDAAQQLAFHYTLEAEL